MRRSAMLFLSVAVVLSSLFFTGCASKKKMAYRGTGHTSAARQRSTMRAYKVCGKCYTPTYVEVGQKMKGISSWYGPNFHGKYTSNGERYNMYARTAAHKTWPMDTMVRVTNLQNGKSTIVRINDRGPFVRGRIIDCSYAAGKELGLDRMGIAKVQIEVLGFAGKVESPAAIAKARKNKTSTRVRLTNFGVQVGAFRKYEGAKVFERRYAHIDPRYKPIIRKFPDVNGAPLYRVWLMGFDSEGEAREFKAHYNMPGAFIVRN
ncbi:septal ring lytic transglycosylase RlpA family protein [Sulfurovum sp.]|uniref:septal ring lytic transglycosylase RlpA family protein n=1 Tax=Sulfurovum sp. TaxID=1969726 RepID=UPI0025F23FBF|nr:septal ring lytic transglycosylase RlpA family protein [Sulfurovum sp.]